MILFYSNVHKSTSFCFKKTQPDGMTWSVCRTAKRAAWGSCFHNTYIVNIDWVQIKKVPEPDERWRERAAGLSQVKMLDSCSARQTNFINLLLFSVALCYRHFCLSWAEVVTFSLALFKCLKRWKFLSFLVPLESP